MIQLRCRRHLFEALGRAIDRRRGARMQAPTSTGVAWALIRGVDLVATRTHAADAPARQPLAPPLIHCVHTAEGHPR
jgi:hypothetical protein